MGFLPFVRRPAAAGVHRPLELLPRPLPPPCLRPRREQCRLRLRLVPRCFGCFSRGLCVAVRAIPIYWLTQWMVAAIAIDFRAIAGTAITLARVMYAVAK